MIPVFGGRAFPTEAGRLLMDALSPTGPAGGPFGAARVLNSMLVPIRATGDLSFTLIQGLATAFRNAPAAFKAFGYGLDSLILDGRLYGRYAEANREQIGRFVRADGLWNASEFTFEEALRNRTFRRLLAPVKSVRARFDEAFRNAQNVAALENFKAMAGVSKELGPSRSAKLVRRLLGDIAGETSDEVAASIANKMVGRLSTKGLGVRQGQREVESVLAFAPRFYRATFGLLGDAVQGGMRGAEARRTLASLIAGGTALYVGAAYGLGQRPNLDPTRSEFLTLRIGGQNVGFGGPFYGLVRTLAEAVQNPEDMDRFNMKNPLVRWGRGRLSPVLGIAADLLSQSDYLGRDLSSPEEIAEHLATGLLPFAAQTAVREGFGAAAVQFFGGRSYPVSPAQRRNEIARELYGRNYFQLDVDQRQEMDADPEVQRLTAEIDESQRERGDEFQQLEDKYGTDVAQLREEQAADDRALEKGSMDVGLWKQEQGERLGQMAAVRRSVFAGQEFDREADPRTQPIRTALDRYFDVSTEQYQDPVSREVDWAAFFEARDRALAGLSAQQKSVARAEIEKNLTRKQREFREAARVRAGLDKIAKYQTPDGPLSLSVSKMIDDFTFEVSQERKRRLIEEQEKVPLREIARELAARRGQPTLYDWWDALRPGKKGRESYLNPAYDDYRLEHFQQLSYWYPELYDDSGFYERTGIISDEAEEESGLTPVEPPGTGPSGLVPLGVR
jgi:hypothetical protein